MPFVFPTIAGCCFLRMRSMHVNIVGCGVLQLFKPRFKLQARAAARPFSVAEWHSYIQDDPPAFPTLPLHSPQRLPYLQILAADTVLKDGDGFTCQCLMQNYCMWDTSPADMHMAYATRPVKLTGPQRRVQRGYMPRAASLTEE